MDFDLYLMVIMPTAMMMMLAHDYRQIYPFQHKYVRHFLRFKNFASINIWNSSNLTPNRCNPNSSEFFEIFPPLNRTQNGILMNCSTLVSHFVMSAIDTCFFYPIRHQKFIQNSCIQIMPTSLMLKYDNHYRQKIYN